LPIQECTLPEGGKGWKYGESGKCYANRADAEKQAAAEHANGFTGDRMVFDLKSARSYDADGRLHVSLSNISKANVCPYRGDEIPDWENLGLDPKKIYQLYRDAKELEKGAATSNGIQLMSIHIAVSADEPRKTVIAGTTGTDAVFEAPYLKNSLVIWDAEDIKNIEDESVKELSCGYRYKPDMTPGTVDGVPYDGVMRDIVFNHVALVKEGRAGNDVVVADSQINLKEQDMSKSTQLSKTAAMVKGALTACLTPKLAKDQKIDVNPLLVEITKKNWVEKKPALIEGLKTASKGKLAKDANMDDVVEFIDKMKGEDMPEDEEEEDMPEAMDSDAMLQKILEAIKACFPITGAKDEPPQTEGGANANPKDGENKEKIGAKDAEKDDEKVDKKAMDAAIQAAVKNADKLAVDRMNAIFEARETVKPYVGQLAIAMDSAEAVYKAALDMLNVNTKDVHPSAYKAILLAQPKKDDGNRMANDARVTYTSSGQKLIADLFKS
jgi:hypothetical protein